MNLPNGHFLSRYKYIGRERDIKYKVIWYNLNGRSCREQECFLQKGRYVILAKSMPHMSRKEKLYTVILMLVLSPGGYSLE